ncbi:hypothetical protein K491DRAFT_688662 [Lophiostoma macrostomum CBS 122681]|uniref:Uncharacterized protein n=1 Tax=Lophiostoma macrostomum CBS 122681 TaxID=1314788 RepID=A0A6A6TKS4_9PLEO|nr:hypothetical protein K491DRAFT_688662 [Lophiostoma macrostomum CBS 122681]
MSSVWFAALSLEPLPLLAMLLTSGRLVEFTDLVYLNHTSSKLLMIVFLYMIYQGLNEIVHLTVIDAYDRFPSHATILATSKQAPHRSPPFRLNNAITCGRSSSRAPLCSET